MTLSRAECLLLVEAIAAWIQTTRTLSNTSCGIQSAFLPWKMPWKTSWIDAIPTEKEFWLHAKRCRASFTIFHGSIPYCLPYFFVLFLAILVVNVIMCLVLGSLLSAWVGQELGPWCKGKWLLAAQRPFQSLAEASFTISQFVIRLFFGQALL